MKAPTISIAASPTPAFDEELAKFFPSSLTITGKKCLEQYRRSSFTPPPGAFRHVSELIPTVCEVRAMTPRLGERIKQPTPLVPQGIREQVELLFQLALHAEIKSIVSPTVVGRTQSSAVPKNNAIHLLIAEAKENSNNLDILELITGKLAAILHATASNPAAASSIIAYFRTINDPAARPIVEQLITPLFTYAISSNRSEDSVIHKQAMEVVASFIEQYDCYPIITHSDNLMYAANHLFWLDPTTLKKWFDARPDSPFVVFLKERYGTAGDLAQALHIRDESLHHQNCEDLDFSIPYGQQVLLRPDILKAVIEQIDPDDEILLQKVVLGLVGLISDHFMPSTERAWARALIDSLTGKIPENDFVDSERLTIAITIVKSASKYDAEDIAWAGEIITNAASSPKLEIRLRLLGCLNSLVSKGYYCPEAALRVLTANVNDINPQVRVATINCIHRLAATNLQWAQETITQAAKDSHPAVRAAALESMVRIANSVPHPNLRDWAEHLIKVAAASDPAEQVQAATIETAASLTVGGREIPKWVKDLIRAAVQNRLQPQLRLSAVEAANKFISDPQLLETERLWLRNIIVGPRVHDNDCGVRASVLKAIAIILAKPELSEGEMLWAMTNLAVLTNDPNKDIRQKALDLQQAVITAGED